jgi:large subunit ribosomal protein L21
MTCGAATLQKNILSSGPACGKFTGSFQKAIMAYAIFKTGGKQYRVAAGDVIEVEKIDALPGSEATFLEVLFIADGSDVKSDATALKGATVVAEIVGQKKAPKVIAYKYKRRKGYHRTVGHRRKVTQLKIKSING